jgi:predicted RNA-binding protein YlxR (DUF448 family)
VVATERASTPLRTCIGCRRRLPQHALVRCADGPGGAAVGRSAPGRGAWLCSAECFDTAVRRRAFDRAWHRRVPDDTLLALQIAFGRVISHMEELPDAEVAPRRGPMKG